MRLCENGHLMREGASFCGQCGAPVAAEGPETAPQRDQQTPTAPPDGEPQADLGRKAAAVEQAAAEESPLPGEPWPWPVEVDSLSGTSRSGSERDGDETGEPARGDDGERFSVTLLALVLGTLALMFVILGVIATGDDDDEQSSDDSVRETTTSTVDTEALAVDACANDLRTIVAASFETASGVPDTTYILRVYGSADPRTEVMRQVATGVYSEQNRIGTERAVDQGVQEIYAWCDRNAEDFGY